MFVNLLSLGQCFKDESKNLEDFLVEDKDRMRDNDVVEEEYCRLEDVFLDFSVFYFSVRLESFEGCVVKIFGYFVGDVFVLVDSFLFCILFLEFFQEVVSNDENGRKFDINSKFVFWLDVGISFLEVIFLDQDMFNFFYFWRIFLFKIDFDKEFQQDFEERFSLERIGDVFVVFLLGFFNIIMVIWKELEEMIENFELYMDDLDVKVQVDVLLVVL